MAALDDTYTLAWVSYDDSLSEKQIQRFFDGDVAGAEDEIDDVFDEGRIFAVREILNSLIPDPTERAAVTEHGGAKLSDLQSLIYERDDSDVLTDLLRHNKPILMRYHLGNPNEDQDLRYCEVLEGGNGADRVERFARRLARMAGVPFDGENEKVFRQMVVEQAYYGGQLYVIWYADPADLIRCIMEDEFQGKRRRLIGWTDPELVLLDRYNGSGYGERVAGTIRKVFDRERLVTDAEGPGYGWDRVACVHKPAFECKWSITPKVQ